MKQTALALAFVVAACVSSHAAENAAPPLRAGAAAVDITPKEFPLNVPGLFRPRMVERAHDPLHARALVLDDGTTILALVVVDNIGVAQEVSDEAKAIASKRCGRLLTQLDRAELLICDELGYLSFSRSPGGSSAACSAHWQR